MEEKNIQGYHVNESVIASGSHEPPFLHSAPSGKFLHICCKLVEEGWEKTAPVAFMEILGWIHSKFTSTAKFPLKCAYPESSFGACLRSLAVYLLLNDNSQSNNSNCTVWREREEGQRTLLVFSKIKTSGVMRKLASCWSMKYMYRETEKSVLYCTDHS